MLQWERGALTLRRVPRIADRSYFGYGCEDKAGGPAGAGMQTQRDCQAEVLAFLEDPASHHGREIRRIDTHASWVFLVGERALKVKRPVRFPFLDYSTLEQRKAARAKAALSGPPSG